MSSLVAQLRRFNRFYTQRIGVLDEGLLRSRYSLTEVRVLYELAQRSPQPAAALVKALAIDAGYASRILARFERQGLVSRARDRRDARQSLLRLTAKGQRTFRPLDARSSRQAAQLLAPLAPAEQQRLADALTTVERLLAGERRAAPPYLLRTHRPGDLGWIVQRHGALYAEEYGWDERFEALVAGIVARFVERLDPARERCFIAERDGVNVGCVMLVKRTARVGQLRLLLVEPSARGLGIGRRLVDECVALARRAGHRKLVLWTNSVLVEARRVYERAGFRLASEERHHSFGHDLVGQMWELALR